MRALVSRQACQTQGSPFASALVNCGRRPGDMSTSPLPHIWSSSTASSMYFRRSESRRATREPRGCVCLFEAALEFDPSTCGLRFTLHGEKKSKNGAAGGHAAEALQGWSSALPTALVTRPSSSSTSEFECMTITLPEKTCAVCSVHSILWVWFLERTLFDWFQGDQQESDMGVHLFLHTHMCKPDVCNRFWLCAFAGGPGEDW